MSFSGFPHQAQAIQILQRSLQAGRLAHAYLFCGEEMEELQGVARTLAKTINCQRPVQLGDSGFGLDSCDECSSCRRIDSELHPDVRWVRPESKSRIIAIDQVRDLLQTVYLKPTEARFKVAILTAVDRLNNQAANAFLKTLEEPPANCVFILLTTAPQRILETILSRCLRLTFAVGTMRVDPESQQWLHQFGEAASGDPAGILNRYRLLDVLIRRLSLLRERIEEDLTARSPLEKYAEADSKLKEKWEDELAAAVEAEYRRQRSELLALLQTWFRDIWIFAHTAADDLLLNPDLKGFTAAIANRLGMETARENLEVLEKTQRLLYTNVQESLTLEVSLLKLKL